MTASPHRHTPFDLSDDRAYLRWRDNKLEDYPNDVAALFVPVRDPWRVRAQERRALLRICAKTNLVFYTVASAPRDAHSALKVLAEQLGLRALDRNPGAGEDALTALEDLPGDARARYIPYTRRALNWHTDGYYNEPGRQVRAWALHCVRAAASGGLNALLDPEVVYILLRDENSDWIDTLMHPQALTIPANVADGRELRAVQTGPVFAVDADGHLLMRYTLRKRHVLWRDDALTRAAARRLEELLTGPCRYIFRHRFEPGQGVISNNALHNRTAFHDDPTGANRRLILRARFYERVAGN